MPNWGKRYLFQGVWNEPENYFNNKEQNVNIQKKCFSATLILCCTCFLVLQALGEEVPRYDGIIEPNEVVNVGSPVRGVVEEVFTERSVMVEKGEALVQMESSVEQAMVDRARAMAEATGEIRLQREKHAFAKRALARMQELFVSEAISSQAKDKAETEEAVAQFTLQKAMENRLLAELDLKRNQASLDLRTIRSPLSGVVVERFVSPGEFIDEQPLLKIAEIDPLKVEVVVPAEIFGTIQPGSKARIFPDSNPGKELEATVTVVDRVIDAASNTFGVRLKLPNPENQLAGGVRCQVEFVLSNYENVPDEQGDVARKDENRKSN